MLIDAFGEAVQYGSRMKDIKIDLRSMGQDKLNQLMYILLNGPERRDFELFDTLLSISSPSLPAVSTCLVLAQLKLLATLHF